MDVVISLLLAFGLTGTTIGILIPRARQLGLLDDPGGRKAHTMPTPIVGGLAIFVGLLAGFAVLEFVTPGFKVIAGGYLSGAALLLTAGYLDDRRRLGTGAKAVMQVTAALLLCFGGDVVIRDMGNLLGTGSIQLGWMAVPFTVFAIVGLVNAMNMLDGMDGFAGSVCLAITLPLIWVAHIVGAADILGYLVVFAGAVAGFLAFNVRHAGRPARAFMGDTGSMLLGYTLAAFVIVLSQEPVAGMRPMTVLWVLIVPVMDTFRLMMLRAGERTSPFCADNRHLHHLLAQIGWSVNSIVLFACAATVAFSVAALSLQSLPGGDVLLFYGFAGLFVAYLGLGHYLNRGPESGGRLAAVAALLRRHGSSKA